MHRPLADQSTFSMQNLQREIIDDILQIERLKKVRHLSKYIQQIEKLFEMKEQILKYNRITGD